jgi:hypothetical protein
MLTTIDNPYDPFEQFTSWLLFDIEKGYNSCGYLARIVQLSDDMSSAEVDKEVERAIDEIIANDFLCIRKKVTRQIPTT